MEKATLNQSADELRTWLVERVAKHLNRSADQIEPHVPLAEYGLDSVYALAVCSEIEDHLGLVLDSTVMWDYPTVDALCAFLLGQPAAER
jgi:acyl carrier protein